MKLISSSFVIIAGVVAYCVASSVNIDSGVAPVGRPVTAASAARAGTPNGEGIHDGFFYSWWNDGQGEANYKNTEGGSYQVQWTGIGNFVGGKGWSPGVYDREIKYSGSFQTTGNGYLAIYGWARNPRNTEYYILESHGTYNPLSNGVDKGSVTCNGANYNLTVVNHTGWTPETTYRTYFSVRNPTKPQGESVSGTVNTACHFDAWAAAGMALGSEHAYQVVATEGYYSSGNSSITVS